MARSRASNAALARVFHDACQPLFILDGDRRIIFCNAHCAEFAGVDAEELLGQRCEYHSGDDSISDDTLADDASADASSTDDISADSANASRPARAAALLCPPPAVFAGDATRGSVSAEANGAVISRPAVFHPLFDSDGELTGVVVAIQPSRSQPPADPLLPDTIEQLHGQLARWNSSRRAQPAALAGASPYARRLRLQSAAATQSNAPLLITGPAGSGRHRLAQHIYALRNNSRSLTPVDCAVTDPELLQATLTSVFASAQHQFGTGTLLLLEVDRLPAATQRELSGFLKLPTFEVCTICTSQARLESLATFDATLALQLSALCIDLPPLSTRTADIALLAQLFLERLNEGFDRQLSGFSSLALDQLTAYHWPGELRELREVVQQAVRIAEGVQVESRDLPGVIRHAAIARQLAPPTGETITLDEFLAGIERELIARALASEDGNKSAAAKKLGVNRARLLRRISQLFE